MWFQISQIRLPLEIDEKELKLVLASELQLPVQNIREVQIKKKSLDARHKKPAFIYTLIFQLENTTYETTAILEKHPNLTGYQPKETTLKMGVKAHSDYRPVVVGAGPAGLFAGLRLALAGLKPVIIERGDGIAERAERVNAFWSEGKLDPESNIQYGLGGAGTFSDGKLTTRVKSPYLKDILDILVAAGAPQDIRYWQYPHIGTDLLRKVVEKIQEQIVDNGGEICFRKRLTDIQVANHQIISVMTTNEDRNTASALRTDDVILAVGNSARDIYRMLHSKGLNIQAKPFAIGVRIEHPQDLIDRSQYGEWAGHHKLGPAEYHLTYKHTLSGRGVYSFCMCPGGYVVGATSEINGVVTNGMSYHARDSKIANAAVIVTVSSKDFGSEAPLAGLDFQIALEKKAFMYGGQNYHAPVQRLGDFFKKEKTARFFDLHPTYKPGVQEGNLWDVLPPEISQALADGIKYFGTQLKGYDWPEAVLTGVETRTSAPVRIIRGETLEAEGFQGIYPCGEGAGYAGGIVSSAIDGWKVAEAVISKYL